VFDQSLADGGIAVKGLHDGRVDGSGGRLLATWLGSERVRRGRCRVR
jgi:hypothetical protein